MTHPPTPGTPGTPVTWKPVGSCAVVTIDSPPVNALSAAVRRGLLVALDQIVADHTVSSVALTGAGTHFVAGSDLHEFDGPIPGPDLPTVLAALDTSPVPVVALLHGVALGGGLELALACDVRLAAPDARLGLPEVTLGMLPGAGGTQRLPRAVGRAAALDLICGGHQIDAEEARRLGLVDRVLDPAEDPVTAAVAAAAALGRRRLRDLDVPRDAEEDLAAALERAHSRIPTTPHVSQIIDLVCSEAPFDEALRSERAAFHLLRTSPKAKGLRYALLTERSAARRTRSDTEIDIGRVGVVGAGTMGRSIAIACASSGIDVVITDSQPDALDAAVAYVEHHFDDRVRRGRLSPDAADRARRLIAFEDSLEALASVRVAIEAVVEQLQVKQDVVAALGRVTSPGTLIATNTSYLDIDAIASGTDRAADVVGLHFFHPANVMRLVEVVPGAASSPQTVAIAFSLAARLGKVAVPAGNQEGFIGNRTYTAYRAQAEALLLHGALPAQVDAAAQEFGFAMGPFRVSDSSGLDIAWASRTRARAAGTMSDTATIADRLCELGRFGVKTGAGWYRYAPGDRTPHPDAVVTALIEDASEAAGIERRHMSDQLIVGALTGALLGAAAATLKEGTAHRPEDVDLVWLHGYGFPRTRGGPVFWARHQDADDVLAAVRAAASRTDTPFDHEALSSLLTSTAQT